MMNRNDPAFPGKWNECGNGGNEGMTLRDYFAAKAMQAFCGAEYNSKLDCAHWAKHAYMMADAMLAERVK